MIDIYIDVADVRTIMSFLVQAMREAPTDMVMNDTVEAQEAPLWKW